MNFKNLTIKLAYNNKKHLLYGRTPRIETIYAKSLDKIDKGDAELFMIRIVNPKDTNSEAMLHNVESKPAFVNLIQELFADPKGLPPQRDQFDYKISLTKSSNPVNMRS